MQRVLSFPVQSNRGFGDPSEFVSKRMCFSFMFSIAFLAILAGFLLGRFVFDQELELSRTKLRKAHQHHEQVFGVYKNYSLFNATSLTDHVTASSLERNLLALRNVTGPRSDSSRSLHEAKLIRSALKDAGFDLTSPLVQSQVNLSFPNPRRENQVLILQGSEVVFRCNDSRSPVSEPADRASESSATASGNIFYVNFGRDEDYHHLDSLGLTVKDSVVLARVGTAAPVDIITNALEHEASGILLYPDPQQKDVDRSFLAASDLAKLNSLYSDVKAEEALPVLCIRPDDAERIFWEMSTRELSPESWRGGLNSSYPIGPGFRAHDRRVVLNVNTVNTVKKYYDVLGALRGTQEPDRFVMVAHERKSNGESTAIAMEIIRILGILKNAKDWRPHRSIVIASWGADTSFRSRSWWSQLKMKAVAYLSIESGPIGDKIISSRGTPILDKVFRAAVKSLSLGEPSMDVMLRPGIDANLAENGVPFLELAQSKGSTDGMKEVTSFWTILTWELAESHGLPFSLDAYVRFLNHSIRVIEQRFKMIAQRHNLFLESFFEATRRLSLAIASFQVKWSHADLSKSIEMRIMNDQYLLFTNALSCQEDGSGFERPSRHIIFSRSGSGSDPSAGFGHLQDLLRQTTSTDAPDDIQQQILTHLASLVECINAARHALEDGLEGFVLGKNDTQHFLR